MEGASADRLLHFIKNNWRSLRTFLANMQLSGKGGKDAFSQIVRKSNVVAKKEKKIGSLMIKCGELSSWHYMKITRLQQVHGISSFKSVISREAVAPVGCTGGFVAMAV